MKRSARLAATVALCLSVFGCALNREYVRSDKATFEALAPEYLKYVQNDPALDADQRARRVRTVESWRLRLEEATR